MYAPRNHPCSLSGYRAAFFLLPVFMIFSCSSPKEEIKPVEVQVEKTPVTPPPPPRVFQFEDRYFVRNASIDLATNIENPLEAIRVIQLKTGPNQVLVISSFEKAGDTKRAAVETWLGIELPSFSPGTYDLSSAAKVSFYRFVLGEKSERYDGESCTGSIVIEAIEDGRITGSVNATITGKTKSFELPSQPFTLQFTGSFSIQEVPLEATIMKTK